MIADHSSDRKVISEALKVALADRSLTNLFCNLIKAGRINKAISRERASVTGSLVLREKIIGKKRTQVKMDELLKQRSRAFCGSDASVQTHHHCGQTSGQCSDFTYSPHTHTHTGTYLGLKKPQGDFLQCMSHHRLNQGI